MQPLENQIRQLALTSPTKEIGGYVKDGIAYVVDNLSSTKADDYYADKSLFRSDVIFHSHLTNPEFSDVDIYVADKLSLNIIMYCLKTDTFRYYTGNPNKIFPLLNRPSIPGILDCIELLRDYYRIKLNIHLTEFHNPIRLWPYNLLKYRRSIKTQNNILLEYLLKNGFELVSTVRINDIFLLNSGRIISPHNIMIYAGNGCYTHNHGERSKIGMIPTQNIVAKLRHKLLV